MRQVKTYLILSILLLSITDLWGQRRPSTHKSWSGQFMLGSSTLLGDLGGKDGLGTNDFRDIDFNQTRYAMGAGIKFSLKQGLSFGVNALYTRLAGDDAETESDRSLRELHVRTDLLETSFRVEYTVPPWVKKYRGFYLNVGGGLAFFKPMAERNDSWQKLRPLGTEGQFVDPTMSPYKVYTPIILYGVGKKFKLRKRDHFLSVDLSFRKTFTDYLDDVSTVYFDKELIRQHSGDDGAYFSNPSEGRNGMGTPGNIRANPENNDNYFILSTTLEFPLNGKKRYRNKYAPHKKWIRGDGSVPTFRRKGRTRKKR